MLVTDLANTKLGKIPEKLNEDLAHLTVLNKSISLNTILTSLGLDGFQKCLHPCASALMHDLEKYFQLKVGCGLMNIVHV